jgi:hypothetical protein
MSDTKRVRVLLADDNESPREVIREMLEALGHEVVAEAKDGGEALGIFEQNRDGFDLVVTDYRMPRLTGTQLAHGVRLLRPELPVIIVTGDEPNRLVPQDHGCPVLQKPFRMEQLRDLIAQLLGE